MTRGVVVEPVYDAVLQVSAFLSVLPTKILYFPSYLRVAMTACHLFVILYTGCARFTITVLTCPALSGADKCEKVHVLLLITNKL